MEEKNENTLRHYQADENNTVITDVSCALGNLNTQMNYVIYTTAMLY